MLSSRIAMAVLCLTLVSGALAQPGPVADEPPQLHVLFNKLPGAPSPADVVETWTFSSPAPSPGLAVGNPVQGGYLLPLRASDDFRALLDTHPDTARAKLEDYLVIEYPTVTDRNAALIALASDPYVAQVSIPVGGRFSSVQLQSFSIEQSGAASYGWDAYNMEAAWSLAGGHGLVGISDNGLATAHPEFRPFTPGGTFTRGNWLPVYSLDVGRWTTVDTNVDETEPEPVHASCAGLGGLATPSYAGHGSHVAGLVAANPYDDNNVKGICRHCGMGMWRIARLGCNNGNVFVAHVPNAQIASVTHLGDYGVQVINMSYGDDPGYADYCFAQPEAPWCLAIEYATGRGIGLVGASGNHKTEIQFPARDKRVVAAGGFGTSLDLWDEEVGGGTCPFGNSTEECGSNYTLSTDYSRQEVLGAAQHVYGVMYPGFDWNPTIRCGDSIGPGPANDGYGDCTGTSMAAPQVSGLIGLLRSINPLVGMGNPQAPAVTGIRNVLAATTFEAQASQPWSPRIGYGTPDAPAAARRMLGKVHGVTVRNRATPLFSFYGSVAKDYAYTTSPQTALTLLINNKANWQPNGSTVPGYPAFPADPLLDPSRVPRANVFVLATEYKTRPSHPDLVPLYFFDRSRPYPASCTPGAPGCNAANRDLLLATGIAEVEALHAAGYNYRGIQGYIYQRCTPEPACVPQDAQRLWRKCKTADDDCAIFLENQRSSFEANGYTAAVPAGFPQHIGYAYPNIDTDGDGLVNGLEHVIGTSHLHADTDGDGINDGVEFPMAAVAVSDPCDGPLRARCPSDLIFANGFQ